MKGVLRRLDQSGDTALAEWDTEDKASVDAAIAVFEKQLAGGNAVFAVKGGQPDTIVREFDPRAEELIVVRQFMGG